jgi:hypothetical protein
MGKSRRTCEREWATFRLIRLTITVVYCAIVALSGRSRTIKARALGNKTYLQSLMIKGMIIHDEKSSELLVFLLSQENEML